MDNDNTIRSGEMVSLWLQTVLQSIEAEQLIAVKYNHPTYSIIFIGCNLETALL